MFLVNIALYMYNRYAYRNRRVVCLYATKKKKGKKKKPISTEIKHQEGKGNASKPLDDVLVFCLPSLSKGRSKRYSFCFSFLRGFVCFIRKFFSCYFPLRFFFVLLFPLVLSPFLLLLLRSIDL